MFESAKRKETKKIKPKGVVYQGNCLAVASFLRRAAMIPTLFFNSLRGAKVKNCHQIIH